MIETANTTGIPDSSLSGEVIESDVLPIPGAFRIENETQVGGESFSLEHNIHRPESSQCLTSD